MRAFLDASRPLFELIARELETRGWTRTDSGQWHPKPTARCRKKGTPYSFQAALNVELRQEVQEALRASNINEFIAEVEGASG